MTIIIQNEAGSEILLRNAETYGQYFTQALMNGNVNVSGVITESMAITRENIGESLYLFNTTFRCIIQRLSVLRAQFVNQNNVTDISFPPGIDPEQRTGFNSSQTILPREFLINRGASCKQYKANPVNFIQCHIFCIQFHC